jgi:hypothetical protein
MVGNANRNSMEILTPKSSRRSTRLRVEIPMIVTSMDRRHPFSAECVALVVSPQGCGFRAMQALPLETPVLLGDLPGGGSSTGRVASCLPLGNDGKYFLIGVSLYNHGNIWGVADPPEDWDCTPNSSATKAATSPDSVTKNKTGWPYNLTSAKNAAKSRRK